MASAQSESNGVSTSIRMTSAERNELIETIARKVEERAENWGQRRNDYADLYATECAAVASLIRSLANGNATDGR